jgi:hypothetical protein
MNLPDTSEAARRFVEKWSASDLSERAASHEHFIDLCRLITPQEMLRLGMPANKRGSTKRTADFTSIAMGGEFGI